MSDEVTPEDFQAILAQLRDWVRTKVVPREREIADADAIPDDLRKQAADMGLFGYAIPQEWGGLGLDLTQDVELAMELGYTSLAVRSMFGTNNGIAGQVLVNFGTDEQKAAWLERLASGEVVASFALTEPGPAPTRPGCGPAPSATATTGSSTARSGSSPTRRRPTCSWCSPAPGPPTSRAPASRCSWCPPTPPGVEVGAKDRKMGQEGAWTSDVLFSDVRVPASALVGGDVRSRLPGRDDLARARPGAHRGAGRRHRPAGARRVGRLRRLGHPGRHRDRRVPARPGDAGRSADRRAGGPGAGPGDRGARYVSGEDRRIGPSAAKLFCTEMAGQVADLAVQIHGGAGYMRDVPVERIYRDVRLLRLYEGTSEIQRLIIGGGLIRAQQRRLPGYVRP